MANFLNIVKLYRLWRHGHGFGIHSPFAYRFITEVLRQPLQYYAYASLPAPRQKLTFRIVLHLHPQSVAIYGAPDLVPAVKAAWHGVKFHQKNPDLVIIDAGFSSEDENNVCSRLIAGGASAIIFNYKDFRPMAATLEAMEHGMSFCNGNGTMVIAALKHLPRQDFDVKF